MEKGEKFSFIEVLTIVDKVGLDSITKLILNEIRRIKARRLDIDPITTLLNMLEPKEIRAFLHTTLSRLVKPQGISMYLIADLSYGIDVIGYGFEEFIVDAVLKLIVISAKRLARRVLKIHKVREVAIPMV